VPVGRLLAADEPPRYRRALQGSMLDPRGPVLLRLVAEWPLSLHPAASP
jgi:hypothetical protein